MKAMFRLSALTRHLQPSITGAPLRSFTTTSALSAAATAAAGGSGGASAAAVGGSGSGKKITDYSRFISALSKRRQPSAIRSLMALVNQPGMISLGGGLPNPAMFPFKEMEFTLTSGQKLSLSYV